MSPRSQVEVQHMLGAHASAGVHTDNDVARHIASGSSVKMQRPCGHSVHVGSCAACQRLQLERWRSQLWQADAMRDGSLRLERANHPEPPRFAGRRVGRRYATDGATSTAVMPTKCSPGAPDRAIRDRLDDRRQLAQAVDQRLVGLVVGCQEVPWFHAEQTSEEPRLIPRAPRIHEYTAATVRELPRRDDSRACDAVW